MTALMALAASWTAFGTLLTVRVVSVFKAVYIDKRVGLIGGWLTIRPYPWTPHLRLAARAQKILHRAQGYPSLPFLLQKPCFRDLPSK